MNFLIDNALLITIAAALFICVAAVASLTANSIGETVGFYRQQFTGSANVELSDLFIFTDAKKLFWINVVVLIIVPWLVHRLFLLPLLTLATFMVLLLVPGLVWRGLRKKRLAKFEEQLPDAFMLLSSSLQAGASLNSALEDMVEQSPAPLSQEFGLLIKRMRLGVSLEDGLIELEQRIPLPSFVMASSAVRISREVGGNLVDTINNMARTLRRKRTMEGKIDSLTAQGRAQGTFMALLPVGLAIVLGFLEPEAMRKLFTTRNGIIVLSVMVVMQGLGFFFISRITKIDS